MWEYRVINLNVLPRKVTETDLLNEAGAEGWELVIIVPNLNVAYFKRAMSDGTETAPVASKRRKAAKS